MTIFAPINDGLNGWSRTGLSAMIDNYRRVPTEGRLMTTQELSDKIVEVKQELTSQIAELKRMMSVMQWMLGLVLLAVVLPILRDAVS